MSVRIHTNKTNVDAILRGVAEEVNKAMEVVDIQIEKQVRPAAATAIADCYEMRSLINGPLQGHLGIRPGDNDNAVFQIAQSVASAVYVDWKSMPVNGNSSC